MKRKKEALKNHYIRVYDEYTTADNRYSLKDFESSIDDYNAQGDCGY